MIAIDTNILVYAHRAEMREHERARSRLEELAGSAQRWVIPWPCVHEFFAIVTRESLRRPSTLAEAFGAIEAWMNAGTVNFITEGESHWELLHQVATQASLSGGMIHDARIVAICIAHGVSELWSTDRDFSRFPRLKTVNPLVS